MRLTGWVDFRVYLVRKKDDFLCLQNNNPLELEWDDPMDLSSPSCLIGYFLLRLQDTRKTDLSPIGSNLSFSILLEAGDQSVFPHWHPLSIDL